MYLPPATPVQAHAVYQLLHVSSAAIRLERIYVLLYFGSTLLHLIIRLAFLFFGLSADLRTFTDGCAARLYSLSIIRRLQTILRPVTNVIGMIPVVRRLALCYSSLWKPELVRSAFIYYLLYTAIFTLLWLPLSVFEDFTLPHRYGLSHQPIIGWLSDLAKDTAVSGLLGACFAAVIIWVIAAFPKRWATIFALWSAPIILAGIFLDPLFGQIDNHFMRLPPSSALYAPLHELAARAGVPKAVILVADKSRQTDETNAYVTGLGTSAQIVIWDTTIKRMPTDEVVAIIGHELGHYVEHHVIIGGLLAAISMFLLLPLLQYLSECMLMLFERRWKIRTLADPAAIPVLIVSFSVLGFLTSPIANAVSRVIEHRADSFGLAVTGNRIAMARAMVDLANENLMDPYPARWQVFWLEDHPPFGERIRFALYGQPMELK